MTVEIYPHTQILADRDGSAKCRYGSLLDTRVPEIAMSVPAVLR